MSYQQQLNDAAKRCHVGSYAVGANRICAEADATIAAKDAEIASLREELARVIDPARAIAAHAADAMTAKDMVIGALLDTLRQWKYAEDNNDRDELANARTNRDEALSQESGR